MLNPVPITLARGRVTVQATCLQCAWAAVLTGDDDEDVDAVLTTLVNTHILDVHRTAAVKPP